jgi:hypothetical protein
VVCNLHLLQDSGTVVGDSDVAIGRNQDLVEATGTEGALDDVCDCPGGEDVVLDGFVTELSLLLALAADNSTTSVQVLGVVDELA